MPIPGKCINIFEIVKSITCGHVKRLIALYKYLYIPSPTESVKIQLQK